MSADKKYLLDANVFIEAKRCYYAFDLCPGFWNCLVHHHRTGQVFSVDRIKQELERGGDELTAWGATLPEIFFASTANAAVINWFGQMQAWVQAQFQFLPTAKAEFATVADGWLIAYAKAYGIVLVTHEEHAPDVRRKVPIPNVCTAFHVDHVDSFMMLRDLGVQFTWSPLV